MAVHVGKRAPDFKAEAYVRGAHGPKTIALSDFVGKWVVLFFYPRDFSFICPTEIQDFARHHGEFDAEDAVLLGASTDSFFVHKAWFESDRRLKDVNFPVITDTAHTLAEEFDVLLPDGGTNRGTFIIDPDGTVQHMSVNSHDVGRNVDEVLRILRGFQTGELCPVGWRPGQETIRISNEWLRKAFPTVPEHVLKEATDRLETKRYAAGETVIAQGEPPMLFYVVVNGTVEVVRRDAQGEERQLAELAKGEFFGEIGLLTDVRRTASVRAKTDVELLALDWDGFRRIVEASDPTANDLSEIVAKRLANV